MSETAFALDIQGVIKNLPHRYPFLLVDRVLECIPRESIIAYKNVTNNEPFFQGHFPGLPVMPGVLILEALAQASALIAATTLENPEETIYLFTGIDSARFRIPVRPGDRLDLHCTMLRRKLQLCKISGKSYVDGKLAAEAELTAALTKRSSFAG